MSIHLVAYISGHICVKMISLWPDYTCIPQNDLYVVHHLDKRVLETVLKDPG